VTDNVDPFVGEIRVVGFNFAPTGWALCNGQLLPLSQNTALFSLLGTFYGGDGKVTFALPDLQGMAPIHQGQGPGLSEYVVGESAGVQAITLLQSEIPIHNHSAFARNDPAELQAPAPDRAFARTTNGFAYSPANPNVNLSPQALAVAGGSQPHNNMQPFLVMNYIIALQGVFPARS
jgi:microcystin-dependent protein